MTTAFGTERTPESETIAAAVNAAEKPVVLVSHSIGTAAIPHAAPLFAPGKVIGGFLVGLSDWNRENLLPGVHHDFAPLPREPLSFPSLLVASRNDPYCDFEVAAHQLIIRALALHLCVADLRAKKIRECVDDVYLSRGEWMFGNATPEGNEADMR